MIEKSLKEGPTTEEAINVLEMFLEVKLTDDYKKFLLEHNGGHPEPSISKHSCVRYLFGLHNGPYHCNLVKRIKMYQGRIPEGIIPIASDPGGNLFCLALKQNRGSVYFWDHEREEDEPSMNNMEIESTSFNSFIEELKEDA